MIYYLGESLKPASANDTAWAGKVFLLNHQQLEQFPLPEWIRQRIPEVGHRRLCRVDVGKGQLWGTLRVPASNNASFGLAFFLDCEGLLLWDDNGFAQKRLQQEDEAEDFHDPVHLFCYFLCNLIHEDSERLSQLENHAAKMEESALEGASEDFTPRLMSFRKELMTLSHYYLQLSDLALRLQQEDALPLSQRDQHMLEILSQRTARLREETSMLQEYSMQIREVYQSQLELRQNNIMKVLTIVTTIFLPLSLIAGWYGMNFTSMPELHWQYGYPLVILLSAGIVLLCIWYFKRKRFW